MYGTLVADARRARGLSQTDLARVSGIEQGNISAIENGRRVPSAATLHRLLNACGFELMAAAGKRVLVCPPPPGDDLLDALLRPHDLDEPPIVTRDTPMAVRVEVLTGVLAQAEAVIRSR
jgi:transcriptional regulator with XRE-family HTH domain